MKIQPKTIDLSTRLWGINTEFVGFIPQILVLRSIGLITVFDAILTGRQSGQKLQCLYGNPMANNIFQN